MKKISLVVGFLCIAAGPAPSATFEEQAAQGIQGFTGAARKQALAASAARTPRSARPPLLLWDSGEIFEKHTSLALDRRFVKDKEKEFSAHYDRVSCQAYNSRGFKYGIRCTGYPQDDFGAGKTVVVMPSVYSALCDGVYENRTANFKAMDAAYGEFLAKLNAGMVDCGSACRRAAQQELRRLGNGERAWNDFKFQEAAVSGGRSIDYIFYKEYAGFHFSLLLSVGGGAPGSDKRIQKIGYSIYTD